MTADPRPADNRPAMTAVELVTLVLRVLMETWVVAGFAWWGYRIGHTPPSSVLLAIAAPVIGFGIWGAVDFHQLGRAAEPLRLVEELVLSGLAVVGLFVVGQHVLAVGLAVLSVVYHVLVYAQGSRLLEPRQVPVSNR